MSNEEFVTHSLGTYTSKAHKYLADNLGAMISVRNAKGSRTGRES